MRVQFFFIKNLDELDNCKNKQKTSVFYFDGNFAHFDGRVGGSKGPSLGNYQN